ncbi:hypothetical protein KL928_001425 [Ogataea angusta]|uniref:Uncharacterized protein n=1 Tax=Pichia angusta TaxID=870730 RepID=A0AAN6I7V7_PICAN|nr:uncharacterized protein KL928_001425 [Ogataea angusta]KAG7821341.1 hypothetical protein KL928_001425 [Ogataea angusta]
MANEDEISKEERLEQARKKFEELKKKKKGKKKGNVGDHQPDSPSKEVPDHSHMETAANTAKNWSTAEASESAKSETLATPDDGDSGAESIINKQEARMLPHKNETGDEKKHYGDDRKGQECSKTEIVGSTDLPDLDTESAAKQQSTLVDERRFQSAEERHGDVPSKQMRQLEAKLSSAVEQNSRLSKENSELKSAQVRLTSKISALEEKLRSFEILNESLRRQLSENVGDTSCAEVPNGRNTFPDFSFEKESPIKSSPSFQTFNNFNTLSNDYLDIVDIRERLSQWKGWNPDMKLWRTVGSGSLLEL